MHFSSLVTEALIFSKELRWEVILLPIPIYLEIPTMNSPPNMKF